MPPECLMKINATLDYIPFRAGMEAHAPPKVNSARKNARDSCESRAPYFYLEIVVAA
jgi:hypothetical protein